MKTAICSALLVLVLGASTSFAQAPPRTPGLPDLSGLVGPVEDVTCPKGWMPTPEEDFARSGNTRKGALQMRALTLKAGNVGELKRPDLPVEIQKDPTLLDVCETPEFHATHSNIEGQQKAAEAQAKADAARDFATGAVGAGLAGGLAGRAGAAAAPGIGRIAGGLAGRFARRGPSVESLSTALATGRFEWKELKFKKGSTELDDFKPEMLQMLQQAFAKTQGQFVVWVPAELDKGVPNTEMQAQRAKAVHAMLVASSIPADRLLEANAAPQSVLSDKDRQPVKAGEASAFLIRVIR